MISNEKQSWVILYVYIQNNFFDWTSNITTNLDPNNIINRFPILRFSFFAYLQICIMDILIGHTFLFFSACKRRPFKRGTLFVHGDYNNNVSKTRDFIKRRPLTIRSARQ